MLWLLPVLPLALAPAIWRLGSRRSRSDLGRAAAAVLAGTAALAVWAAAARPSAGYRWGAGITLRLTVDGPAAVMAVLVATVGLVVVAYAAAHEAERALPRLVATLVAFVGAMELLVLAGDVLTLLIGWELVGGCSWALIAHEWRLAAKPAAAAHAFLVTRVGDLGLFAAVGAAFAATGSVAYGSLSALEGGWLHLFVAGVVLAAAAKSAQVPFSPWLFSAMEGPTSVSALLHAAAMVAAGAYALVRLHPVLDGVEWFGPVVIGIGLATAVAGGIVASVQSDAKKLLAASTSAQFGLMFLAVGAGYPAAALAHLTTHAAMKAGLFLAAGIAIEAVGGAQLGRMGLGRVLPSVASASAVVALALAAVPPLGAAWSKEQIAAAAGHRAPWLAVGVAVAGGLSAWYAARFQLLAFGPPRAAEPTVERRPREGWCLSPPSAVDRPAGGQLATPRRWSEAGRPPRRVAPKAEDTSLLRVERSAVALTALASLALGLLWWPGAEEVVVGIAGPLAPAGAWETALSLVLVAMAVGGALAAYRRGTLLGRSSARVADWFGIPAATRIAVADPAIALAAALARFDDAVLGAPARTAAGAGRRLSRRLAAGDDRIVDAGVRATARAGQRLARFGASVTERGFDGVVGGIAGVVSRAGRDSRRLHTGRAHQYYVVATAGALVLIALAVAGR